LRSSCTGTFAAPSRRCWRTSGITRPKDLWDGRNPHYLRLVGPAAQSSQLVYDYENRPAAGLVARPGHMPGRVFEWGLWKTDGRVIKKPPVYFDKSRASELMLVKGRAI